MASDEARRVAIKAVEQLFTAEEVRMLVKEAWEKATENCGFECPNDASDMMDYLRERGLTDGDE